MLEELVVTSVTPGMYHQMDSLAEHVVEII
jgi:hypothetical protein